MAIPKQTRLPITDSLVGEAKDDALAQVAELNHQLDELYSIMSEVYATLAGDGGGGVAGSGEPYVLHGATVTLPGSELHRDLTGADLHEPKPHSASHEQGGVDALSVGAPSEVGQANAEGVAADYARRDHHHGLRESGGDSLTLGSIDAGEFLQRVGTAIVGVTAGAGIGGVTMETPTGTINGVNDTFTLSDTPTSAYVVIFIAYSPAGAAVVFFDNVGFTRVGATLTYSTPPPSGAVHRALYVGT